MRGYADLQIHHSLCIKRKDLSRWLRSFSLYYFLFNSSLLKKSRFLILSSPFRGLGGLLLHLFLYRAQKFIAVLRADNVKQPVAIS